MAAPLNDKELFTRLVAFDSVSGKNNHPIADFICDYLGGSRRGGVEILRRTNQDDSRVNIVARIAPNTRGAGVTDPFGNDWFMAVHRPGADAPPGVVNSG